MEKKTSFLYKLIKWVVRLLSPKYEVIGLENLPSEPSLIVGNHCQLYGPLAAELHFPKERYTWCAGEMLHLKDVPSYAFQDFWSQKPKYIQPFYKVVSYLIAPLSVLIFNNADTIAVYHDTRILSTFKSTIAKLNEGANVIIFPEKDEKYNNIIYNFQDRFIDIAKLYFKRTGKELSFVPLYIAPKLGKMCIGKAITFNPNTDFDEERARICKYLMDEITASAIELPKHTVIPYRNIRKRDYPKNKE